MNLFKRIFQRQTESKEDITPDFDSDSELIGLYPVQGEDDIYLVEMLIRKPFSEFDVGDITQPHPKLEQPDWQVPWDEKYLNSDGTEVIGDDIDLPDIETPETRLAFFMHEINLRIPLLSFNGYVRLKPPEEMPTRLSKIVVYEKP